jgi:chaperone required for assembly of F1-ATPase
VTFAAGGAIRRFYGSVAVEAFAEGFAVTLDGRQARSAQAAPLVLPTRSLAEAVADEWRSQTETIESESMPLTRLAYEALDRASTECDRIVEAIMGFAGTDHLCYRASEPPALVERQEAAWQPILDWVSEAYGARLRVTSGVIPVEQPAGAIFALRRVLEARDAFALVAIASAARAAGSLVIALALASGRIGAEDAFGLSQLDESFQMERWGTDAEAIAPREGTRANIRAAAAFLSHLGVASR